MSVLETLRNDHQRILAQLKSAEKSVRHIEKNQQLDLKQLSAIVDSILGYFTSDVHAREKAIFSELKAADLFSDGNQLFLELEAENKACHELLKNISRQTHPPVTAVDRFKTRLVENLWTVIELRRRHIEKVQERVYPFLEGYVPRTSQRTRNLAGIRESLKLI